MFKVTNKGMNRLDIELSGKLNSEEMKIALDELVNKSQEIENGTMLYVVIDFQSLMIVSTIEKHDIFGKSHRKLQQLNFRALLEL